MQDALRITEVLSDDCQLNNTAFRLGGRLAVCNLACEGLSSTSVSSNTTLRMTYIGGLSPDTSSEILLNFFSRNGEIEEGSVAYDKDTNKSRGFGFVTYKTVEAAKKAIDDPNKVLGGSGIRPAYCFVLSSMFKLYIRSLWNSLPL